MDDFQLRQVIRGVLSLIIIWLVLYFLFWFLVDGKYELVEETVCSEGFVWKEITNE